MSQKPTHVFKYGSEEPIPCTILREAGHLSDDGEPWYKIKIIQAQPYSMLARHSELTPIVEESMTPKINLAAWKSLAQEALDIDRACNMLGLSKRFAEVVQEVSDLILRESPDTYSTDVVNRNFIVALWANKLNSLSGSVEGTVYGIYRSAAKEVANLKVPQDS